MVDVNPRVMFCDDLGAPGLAIIMDYGWWDSSRDEIIPWLQDRGCAYSHMPGDYLILMDEQTKIEFMLRWA